MKLRAATSVNTSAVTAVGLIGGWLTARETGIRPLGGVLLGAAGAYAARTWAVRDEWPTAVGLTALYLGSFGASHPLAKKIGAWPSVLAVTAVSSGAAYVASERRR